MSTVGLSLGFAVFLFLAFVALCIAWVLVPLILLSIRRHVRSLESQAEWRNKMQFDLLELQREQTASTKAVMAKISAVQAPKG